jgi:hypothetical protein
LTVCVVRISALTVLGSQPFSSRSSFSGFVLSGLAQEEFKLFHADGSMQG